MRRALLVFAVALLAAALVALIRLDDGPPKHKGATSHASRPQQRFSRRGDVVSDGSGAQDARIAGPGLHGEIFDEGGGGIPGATVTAKNARGAQQAAADSSGAYNLALEPGDCTVTVEAEGYLSITQHLTLAGDLSRDFRLSPAAHIEGVVLTAVGRRPVPGASVWLQALRESEETEPARLPRPVTTDASGAFAMRAVAPGRYAAFARAGRQLGRSETLALALSATLTRVEILVKDSLVLAGRVIDGARKPIAGVAVQVKESGTTALAGRDDLASATTADGAFRFEGLQPGAYEVEARLSPLLPARRKVFLVREVLDVELLLVKGASIKGLVTDAAGRPAPAISLRAWPLRGATSASATSSPDGTFLLAPLPAGPLVIVAEHETLGVATFEPLPIEEGQVRTITLRLAPWCTIAGRVRQKSGMPIPNAAVDASGGGVTRRDQAGPDGAFGFDSLPPGIVTVQVSVSGRAPAVRSVTLRPGEKRTGVDLVLPDGLSIDGVVVDGQGSGVPGARISASLRSALAQDGHSSAVSDNLGRFSLHDLDPGLYDVHARAATEVASPAQAIAAGASGVRLVLAAEATIEGVALRADGSVAENVTVALLSRGEAGGGPALLGLTRDRQNAPGPFILRGGPPGRHELFACTAEGSAGRTPVPLVAGQTLRDVRVLLQPPVSLTGRLVGKDERPIPGAVVSAASALIPLGRSGASSADGTFALDGLCAGDVVRLRVQIAPATPPALTTTVMLPEATERFDAGLVRVPTAAQGP